jgi:uncharacterized protein
MLVVSDTSAISNLALLGLLNSLREQFGSVVIPDAVTEELAALQNADATRLIGEALRFGWLESVTLTYEEQVFASTLGLDRGESEAIALAKTRSAELLCIDEAEGRAVAMGLDINVKGVLGILLDEKAAGRISQIGPHLDKLQEYCGFFISAALKARVLGLAGE